MKLRHTKKHGEQDHRYLLYFLGAKFGSASSCPEPLNHRQTAWQKVSPLFMIRELYHHEDIHRAVSTGNAHQLITYIAKALPPKCSED